MCEECYSDDSRITPLTNPLYCLLNHTQYICGTCGRCICIERDIKRNLWRWSFPFKSVQNSKLYLRTANYSMKRSCNIYEVINNKGRVFYKIFPDIEKLQYFIKKNDCKNGSKVDTLFSVDEYKEFPFTQIRKLNLEEAEQYMLERCSK